MNVRLTICVVSKYCALNISVLQKNHASAASRSSIKDEAIVFTSATDNLCNEEQNDATSEKHSKSCALNMLHTNSSCEIIETNSISSATKDSFKKKEIEIRRGTSESKNPSAGQTKSAKRRREDKSTIGSGSGSKRCNLGKSNEQEKKPRSTPINLFDDECAFCHSFRITEVGFFQFLFFHLILFFSFLGQGRFSSSVITIKLPLKCY